MRDASVDELTQRIQRLEGELVSAEETVRQRRERRGASAPPTGRAAPKAANPQADGRRTPPPRKVADNTSGACCLKCGRSDDDKASTTARPAATTEQGEVSQNAPSNSLAQEASSGSLGAEELWSLCQELKAERQTFMELIRDACTSCDVEPAVNMQTRGADADACEPKALLAALCSAHLGLRKHAKESSESESEQIRSLQEQLWESEAQRSELQNRLEDAKHASIDVQDGEGISLAGRNGLISGLSAAPGHYDANNSVLSVPFSPLGMSDSDDLTMPGSRAGLRPFREALDALQPLLLPKEFATISEYDTGDEHARGEGCGLQGLSLSDRMDLLDLAAAIRNAESILLGSAEKHNLATRSHLCRGGSSGALGVVASLSGSSGALPSAAQHLQNSAGALSRASLGSSYSSMGSLPAASRLSELADEKLREIIDLQHRCDVAQGGAERLEAATLLAAAREELRLLREYAGLEVHAGDAARTDHPD